MLLLTLVLPLLLAEFTAAGPKLAEQIVRMAARLLPASSRSRYEQEWLAHLFDVPGSLVKVGWALTTVLGALIMRPSLQAAAARTKAQDEVFRALGVSCLGYEGQGDTLEDLNRIADLSTRLGHALGLQEEELHPLRWGVYIHDIGKLHLPSAVLHKPGALTKKEWDVVRRHTEAGYSIVCQVPDVPQATLDIVRLHHERFDGAGFPLGLKGEQIPLAARMFCVVDVYEALRRPRPYKGAWTHEQAMAEINAQAGRMFDPQVVAAFNTLFDKTRAA